MIKRCIIGSLLSSIVSLFLVTMVYAACISGDCENGKGMMTYEDGTQYTGEFKDGKPHGMGTFTYPKGKTLEVEKPLSYGGKEFTRGLPMGEKYVGEIKDGMRHGSGTLSYYSKATYTGEFRNDMLNGKGTMVNPNGVIYEGEFVNGQPNGIGKVTFPDGRIYEGEVKRNQITGQGVMTYPDGRKEEGVFLNGRLKTEEKGNQ